MNTARMTLPRLWRWGVLFMGLWTVGWAQSSYTVAPGDTLSHIARAHATTVSELMRLNGLQGSLIHVGQVLRLPSTAPQPRSGLQTYTLGANETLLELSRRYGLSEATLRRANPDLATVLSDVPLIPGQSVLIPPAEGAVVRLRPGETLLSVALEHGLSVSELARVNALGTGQGLTAGQPLFIPLTESPSVGGNAASTPGASAAAEVSADPRAQHVERQLELLARAPQLLAAYEAVAEPLAWPLSGRLTSRYGRRNISVGGNTFHGGIDISAPRGTPIAAASGGHVTRAGWGGAYGYVVYVDHGDGRQTRYAHMDQILVALGQRVRQGDTLGLVGSSGASTGPHLHFELRFDGRSVDPLGYLP